MRLLCIISDRTARFRKEKHIIQLFTSQTQTAQTKQNQLILHQNGEKEAWTVGVKVEVAEDVGVEVGESVGVCEGVEVGELVGVCEGVEVGEPVPGLFFLNTICVPISFN